LFTRHHTAHDIDKCDELDEAKDAQRGHVLGRADGQELDKRYLHRSDRAEHVPGGIGSVKAVGEAVHQDQDKGV
jgi:hypothetical protein